MKTRKLYTISGELRGKLYRSVLALAQEYCSEALLVTREGESLSDHAVTVNRRLAEFETNKEMAAEWPGTRLHGGEALVARYRLDPGLIRVLGEVTDGLYEWLHPDLPEDLCLLRADGTPWLASIAHEHDAYFEMSEEEYEQLIGEIPEMESYLEVDQ